MFCRTKVSPVLLCLAGDWKRDRAKAWAHLWITDRTQPQELPTLRICLPAALELWGLTAADQKLPWNVILENDSILHVHNSLYKSKEGFRARRTSEFIKFKTLPIRYLAPLQGSRIDLSLQSGGARGSSDAVVPSLFELTASLGVRNKT